MTTILAIWACALLSLSHSWEGGVSDPALGEGYSLSEQAPASSTSGLGRLEARRQITGSSVDRNSSISRARDPFERLEFLLKNPSRLVINRLSTEDQEMPFDAEIDAEHWKIMDAYASIAPPPAIVDFLTPVPFFIKQEAPPSKLPVKRATGDKSTALFRMQDSARSETFSGVALPLEPRSAAITVGRGELLQFPNEVSRVSVTDPAIADAVVVSPHEIVLNGKSPGNTTIMIWHGDNVSTYHAAVEPDISAIQSQMRAAFPNEQIEISCSKDSILLTGKVSDAGIVNQAAAVAAAHAKSVVNLLQAPPADRRQVMLQVKFATVDRALLSQVGVNLFSVNSKLVGTSTTQQYQFPRIGQLQFSSGADGQPVLGNQSVGMSDLLNLFAFRTDLNAGAVLRMLQSKNVLEILAEPNLITVSGREASFMAGGKFPFPVISSTGSGAQTAPVVTLQFRDFGVRLSFTPTVEPNGLIHLKVRPEVSSLDFSNAITMQGFLIPAISTREVETEVDLREGETFAIAGLMDNRVTQVMNKIPGIGNLPIIGYLFRSRETKKSQSELLVLTTPTFVKPMAAGEQPPLPRFPEGFLDSTRPDRKPPAPPRDKESPGKIP